MASDLFDKIRRREDTRKNLISLKMELQNEIEQDQFLRRHGEELGVLAQLLKEQDPKTRKNAANIMGLLKKQMFLHVLYEAYTEEKTLFVRSDYLKSMAELNCSDILDELKEQESKLSKQKVEDESRKHVREELEWLRKIILQYEKPQCHAFVYPAVTPDVILLTNRCQREVTAKQVTTGKITGMGAGLRISGGDLQEIMAIRTFSELLFVLPQTGEINGSAEEIGKALADASIPQFLDTMYAGESDRYYYRVEIKGNLPIDKKGGFIRKIADVLEEESCGRLINSASDYEVEIRLLQKKNGSYAVCLKGHTPADDRFAYRTGMTAESIAPYNAALTMQLAADYLKEDAQVLDPFCGVGTMLVEREHFLSAGTMYAVDIFGEAITLGRKNAALAGMGDKKINFVNRDCLTFEHEYPFDEVISDLPRSHRDPLTGEMVQPEKLYQDFFEKIPSLLKNEAILVLYTSFEQYVKKAVAANRKYRIEKRFDINEKNGTVVMIVSYDNNKC